jgi:hypothetical protein
MINTQHFVIPACALQGTQAGIQEEIVGNVPRTVRKAARSGNAPYSVIIPAFFWRESSNIN